MANIVCWLLYEKEFFLIHGPKFNTQGIEFAEIFSKRQAL